MHSCVATEVLDWSCYRVSYVRDIELHHFVACLLSSVCHVDGDGDRIARARVRLGSVYVRVCERRVAQAVAEGIEWRAVEESIGTSRHAIVIERRQIIYRF